MNRRDFLQASSAAGLAFSIGGKHASGFSSREAKRVGLIGCGWYGKADLLRLIQVAPVEVVSLCDVDKKMLADAAETVAGAASLQENPAHLRRLSRDAQGERPRHRPDRHPGPLARPAHDRGRRSRRRYLRPEADQHRRQRGKGHAGRRPQAPAGRAGRHPAPQHAPPDRGPRPHHPRRQARQDRPGRNLLLLPHAKQRKPARHRSPRIPRLEMWTGPAPLRPYNSIAHPRGWRAFMEYSNGIMGDMCIHMLDMVRWMLELGWPRRISSTGGILVDKGARPISPTPRPRRSISAISTSSGSIAPGVSPPTRNIPGAPRSTATRERLKASVIGYDFIPSGGGKPIHRDVTYELEQYPRRQDRERPGTPRRAGHPRPHERPAGGDRLARPARSPISSKATSRPRRASWPISPCNWADP